MPAYAKDGWVVCFFQSAQKFKPRYATFGFMHEANLDEGATWPTAFALKELTAAEEARIGALMKKRVILVGHSMGGPVALAAAHRMPGKVVAAIGVDTLLNAETKLPEEASKKFVAAFETDFKGTMRAGLSGLLHAKVDPDLKKWLVARAEAQDEKMAIGLMREMMGLDTKALLKNAKVPVRCINSGGGYQFFTLTAVAVNKKYADYDAVIIESVGHYPMLEKPAEFNDKLRDVLKEFAVNK
jgi:pimeloyl-ACP methyl ester carboxylesterase